MDRGARGVYGARELALELRRVVRLPDARCADRQRRGLEQDCLFLNVRRERRILRSHGAADTPTVASGRHFDGGHNESTVYRQPFVPGVYLHPRTVRAWRPCPYDRYLALEQGWVGQLRGV